MKKQYIKHVKQLLIVPRKQKNIILNDLEEIFQSGNANGESDQEIIQRLGSPKEFVSEIEHGLEINVSKYKQKHMLHAAIFFASGVILLVLCCWIHFYQNSTKIIGQAEATTEILIPAIKNFDFIAFLLIIAVCAFAISITSIVKFRKK